MFSSLRFASTVKGEGIMEMCVGGPHSRSANTSPPSPCAVGTTNIALHKAVWKDVVLTNCVCVVRIFIRGCPVGTIKNNYTIFAGRR